MYKVRTNQVEVPFDQLYVEGENNKTKTTSEAVEEAVAQLRREAQEVEAASLDDRTYPKLLPAPILRPTAYSSRMIYQEALPYSPPTSRTPQRPQQLQQLATPGRPLIGQLSSPPDSADRQTRRPGEDVDAAGSLVKGHVAEGLLGLRHAV